MQQAHTAVTRAEPARRETSGTTRAEPARREASGAARAESAETSQRGARPVARATGRAEASTRRADTSQRSGTSGASCRTSQEPAVPRDKRAQKRISHQGQARAERAKLWVAPGTSSAKEFEDGQCGRPPCAEVAFSGIKGGGAFWILQSRRSERPYGGNCTERHRARTTAGGAAYAVPCESTRT